jgi:hypothetical protein
VATRGRGRWTPTRRRPSAPRAGGWRPARPGPAAPPLGPNRRRHRRRRCRPFLGGRFLAREAVTFLFPLVRFFARRRQPLLGVGAAFITAGVVSGDRLGREGSVQRTTLLTLSPAEPQTHLVFIFHAALRYYSSVKFSVKAIGPTLSSPYPNRFVAFLTPSLSPKQRRRRKSEIKKKERNCLAHAQRERRRSPLPCHSCPSPNPLPLPDCDAVRMALLLLYQGVR